jgi:hypothetical protein
MMKRSCTFSMSRRLLLAVLAGTGLAAGTPPLLGQAALAPAETRNAAPTIFLSGPGGDRFTLIRSEDDGWRLHAGWNAEGTGWRQTALAAVEAPTFAGQQAVERPLTVFVDGPSGFTFIYVLDDGWKFVGRMVERAR